MRATVLTATVGLAQPAKGKTVLQSMHYGHAMQMSTRLHRVVDLNAIRRQPPHAADTHGLSCEAKRSR